MCERIFQVVFDVSTGFLLCYCVLRVLLPPTKISARGKQPLPLLIGSAVRSNHRDVVTLLHTNPSGRLVRL